MACRRCRGGRCAIPTPLSFLPTTRVRRWVQVQGHHLCGACPGGRSGARLAWLIVLSC